jgi:hypothetical protein
MINLVQEVTFSDQGLVQLSLFKLAAQIIAVGFGHWQLDAHDRGAREVESSCVGGLGGS